MRRHISTRTRLLRLLAASALLSITMSIFGLTASTARAQDTQRIQEAIAAYRDAMANQDRDRRLEGFRRAERLFDDAIGSGGANAELYANLGNSALQAERLGPAVLAYRRALHLEPGLERAQQNLEHARGLLPEWVPKPAKGGVLDSFFFWHQSISSADRAGYGALAFAITLLAMSASIYLRSALPRYIAIPAALSWLALMVSLAFDPTRTAHDEGVVITTEVLARAADSINAPSRFGEPLPGGAELKILEDRGGWLHVELHNGRNAWVTSSAVSRIAPEA